MKLKPQQGLYRGVPGTYHVADKTHWVFVPDSSSNIVMRDGIAFDYPENAQPALAYMQEYKRAEYNNTQAEILFQLIIICFFLFAAGMASWLVLHVAGVF